jgi:hypothetical protein
MHTPSEWDRKNNCRADAHIKIAIIANFLRVGFSVCFVYVVLAFDPAFRMSDFADGLAHILKSDQMGTFILHIIISFVGDWLARACCVMDLQIPCFSIPLALCSPICYGLIVLNCKLVGRP